MKKRFITALVIVAIVAIPVFFGGLPLELLALFVIAAASYEWMHIQTGFQQLPKWLPSILGGLVFISRWIPEAYYLPFFIASLVFLWSLPVFYETVDIQHSFSMISFFVLFSLIYKAIGFIQLNHYYLITICFATYGSDTGAYLIGVRFGKNKMNPRISPKKSWEGFFGGVIMGCICGMLVSMCYLESIDALKNAILCLGCPIIAELGDLCFSAMKRQYQAKDFSDLLPGHGGILDRIDSLMMNLLFFVFVFTIM